MSRGLGDVYKRQVIEGLVCDEENLIVYDLHSGESYTLFDKNTGAYITRFGTIGQGPDEIAKY